MAKRITEDKIQEMIRLYEEGKTFIDISNIIDVHSDTISKYLKQHGITYKNVFDRLSEDERNDICQLYLDDNWNEIFEKYKFMTKTKVYHLTSKMGVKKEDFFWSDEHVNILISNYGKSYKEIHRIFNNKYSINAIKNKAIKLGLTSPRDWSDEEIEILTKYYSNTPKNEFLKMLPNRTEAGIVCMAMKLDIKSYQYLNEKYSDEEKQFIIDNHQYMTDYKLSKALNKPLSGIQEQRRKLGIYYLNKDYSGYENIIKFLRGHIQEWKNKSLEDCNYQCILTGSKDFQIHHLYSFNMIVKETFEILEQKGLLKTNNIEDYSKEELDGVLKIFLEIHNNYPLGICVRNDIHDLFHKIYGSGGNTEIQWELFITDYKQHKYDTQLAA